jgi:putative tricarboxylic transport membrane protein
VLLDLFFGALSAYVTQVHLIVLAVAGVLIGIVLGALPGISSTMALAILLPVSFGLEPAPAMLFLIAVFVSSVYGGSISAILINIPGTPGSIVTQFDGYPMAQQGRAGHALSYALLGSTAGGLIGLALLVLLAPAVASAAMNFRSPEFTMAAVFGLVLLSFASEGSTFRGILAGIIGLLCGMVGFDKLTDISRFDFGSPTLQAGIELVPLTVGIFGLAEVLRNIAAGSASLPRVPALGKLFPPIVSLVKLWGSVLRGGLIGTFVGAVPAAGSAIAVALSYEQERRLSKNRARFGQGEPAGIVGPESANSSAIGGALIPMMTLGIPGDSMTAVLMGALLVHGLRPGPNLFANNPDFVASVYASLFLSVVLTLVVGFAFIRVITTVMRIPQYIMFTIITLLCIVGSFAIRNSLGDVFVMIFFGVVGYLLFLARTPPAPLAFGLILGPLLEENLRRSLILSQGSWSIFIERPISAALLLLSVATLLFPIVTPMLKRRFGRPSILSSPSRPAE